MTKAQPVYLVKGDDPSLVNQALGSLVDELVAGRPVDLTLEDLPDEADVGAVLEAVQTPSLLSDRRVIVVRGAGRFRADDAEPLVNYLSAPLPTTSLVLVAGGGAIPTRLMKVVREKGHVVDAALPSGKGRQAWLAAQLQNGPVRLDRSASDLVAAHLGDELGQLAGILDALAAAYGEGSKVTAAQLEPFLGAGGSAAPWELTDAIDSGDTATALAQLRRMIERGERHPLVVMSTLQRHFAGLLRLDGSEVTSEAEAARLLRVAPYPAKKAMSQARRLGSTATKRAVRLVAEADVEIRGASAWPAELVLELLVARLSKLVPAAKGQSGRRRHSA